MCEFRGRGWPLARSFSHNRPLGEHHLAIEHSLTIRPAPSAANLTTEGSTLFAKPNPLATVSHSAPFGERRQYIPVIGKCCLVMMTPCVIAIDVAPSWGGAGQHPLVYVPEESLRLLHLWTDGPGAHIVVLTTLHLPFLTWRLFGGGGGGELFCWPWPTRQRSLENVILSNAMFFQVPQCLKHSLDILPSSQRHHPSGLVEGERCSSGSSQPS